MTNSEVLINLWHQAGQSIDEQRLRIFRMLSDREQRAIIELVALEISDKAVSV